MIPDLDQGTRQAIDDRIRADILSSQDMIKQEQSGQLPKVEAVPFATDKNIVSSAIANKVRSRYDEDLKSIQNLDRLKSFTKQSENVQQAKMLGIGRLRVDQMRTAAIAQRRMNEEAQRSAVLGSVLGLGFTIAGAALGGAPGAIVGGAVGNAAGQMANQG